jgi:CBS domain-containing protein
VYFETTLRDALAMLLASAVLTAVVVDARGRYLGMLTLDSLGEAFRSDNATANAGPAVPSAGRA